MRFVNQSLRRRRRAEFARRIESIWLDLAHRSALALLRRLQAHVGESVAACELMSDNAVVAALSITACQQIT